MPEAELALCIPPRYCPRSVAGNPSGVTRPALQALVASLETGEDSQKCGKLPASQNPAASADALGRVGT